MVNPTRNTGRPLNPKDRVTKKDLSKGQQPMIHRRVKIKHVLIVLTLIAIGAGIFFMLFQNEEKRVKKQFHLLSEAVSKETGENIFTLNQKIKKIGSLFNETCDLHIPAHSISGQMTREEITGYAARGRIHFRELHLKFHDFNITFPKEGEAKARLTARLTGNTATGEAINEAHEIECLLGKIEKKWMFDRIEVVEVLKK
ncbi:MAG: hypothetical protein FJ115_00770 [Deltaproteobacteria bacterium]|nr:hypothetical protein [Deltaproteobacteria bacterium]MBM4322064.1 hypothetical protein [Deltaproteobacteria bacterium]MBM4346509.1 hypothetical protein [Deltaproteobacteria bacterium]